MSFISIVFILIFTQKTRPQCASLVQTHDA
jgi:hypothetical protein